MKQTPKTRKSVTRHTSVPGAETATAMVKSMKRTANAAGRAIGGVMQSIGDVVSDGAEAVSEAGAKAVETVSQTLSGSNRSNRSKGVKKTVGATAKNIANAGTKTREPRSQKAASEPRKQAGDHKSTSPSTAKKSIAKKSGTKASASAGPSRNGHAAHAKKPSTQAAKPKSTGSRSAAMASKSKPRANDGGTSGKSSKAGRGR